MMLTASLNQNILMLQFKRLRIVKLVKSMISLLDNQPRTMPVQCSVILHNCPAILSWMRLLQRSYREDCIIMYSMCSHSDHMLCQDTQILQLVSVKKEVQCRYSDCILNSTSALSKCKRAEQENSKASRWWNNDVLYTLNSNSGGLLLPLNQMHGCMIDSDNVENITFSCVDTVMLVIT